MRTPRVLVCLLVLAPLTAAQDLAPAWDLAGVQSVKRTRGASFHYQGQVVAPGGPARKVESDGAEKEVYTTRYEQRGADGRPTRWVREWESYDSKDLFQGTPSIWSSIAGGVATFERQGERVVARLTRCKLSPGEGTLEAIAEEPLAALLGSRTLEEGATWALPADAAVPLLRLLSDDWAGELEATAKATPLAAEGQAKVTKWKKGQGTLELEAKLALPRGYQPLPGGGGSQEASGTLTLKSQLTFAKGRVTKVATEARVVYATARGEEVLTLRAELKYTWR